MLASSLQRSRLHIRLLVVIPVVQSTQRVIYLLCVWKRTLVLQNYFVSASITQDVINLLACRVSRHVLVRIDCRSTIVRQFYWTCLVEELRAWILSHTRSGMDFIWRSIWSISIKLLTRLGSSLSSSFHIVCQHLAVKECKVGLGRSHILHMLNHSHSVKTSNELICKRLTIVCSIHSHVLRLILRPHSEIIHKLASVSWTFTTKHFLIHSAWNTKTHTWLLNHTTLHMLLWHSLLRSLFLALFFVCLIMVYRLIIWLHHYWITLSVRISSLGFDATSSHIFLLIAVN